MLPGARVSGWRRRSVRASMPPVAGPSTTGAHPRRGHTAPAAGVPRPPGRTARPRGALGRPCRTSCTPGSAGYAARARAPWPRATVPERTGSARAQLLQEVVDDPHRRSDIVLEKPTVLPKGAELESEPESVIVATTPEDLTDIGLREHPVARQLLVGRITGEINRVTAPPEGQDPFFGPGIIRGH